MEQTRKIRIALGTDHTGFELKNQIVEWLISLGYPVEDMGCFSPEKTDYPIWGAKVAQSVSNGDFDVGILLCGTGLGMSIVANKFPNVRAALCNNTEFAEMARKHNNANILCLPSRKVSLELLKQIIEVFLNTRFDGDKPDGERHRRRVGLIHKIEKEKMCP